jgi:hypothetical protein
MLSELLLIRYKFTPLPSAKGLSAVFYVIRLALQLNYKLNVSINTIPPFPYLMSQLSPTTSAPKAFTYPSNRSVFTCYLSLDAAVSIPGDISWQKA